MFGWKIEDGFPIHVCGTVVAPKELLELVASHCHHVAGLIAVAGQLAYHVLRTASVMQKNTV